MMGIVKQYARALLNRVAFGKPTNSESMVIPSEGGAIEDGLSYGLPHMLPGYQRQTLQHMGVLEQYLKESVRTSYNVGFDPPAARDAQYTGVLEDPLLEWNFDTRMYVLSNCHAAYHRNPLGKRCVHYISSFVIGEGFNLTCKNKDVEAALLAFIDNPDNAIREYERQAVRDLCVDGELFIRYFSDAPATPGEDPTAPVTPTSGALVAVPVRPWEIRYIETEDGFFRRRKSYRWQQYSPPNRDDPNAVHPTEHKDIPAREIQHVAINKHAYELRGRPELYAALAWLKAHKDWLEGRSRQNHYRGALLWWFKIKNALPAVIARKVAQYSRPITPGSALVTTDNEEVTALTNPLGASDAGEDGRQLKIMAQNGIGGIPEYMTGDGQNANLASTTSQQLPVLTTFAEFQIIMIEQVLTPMFKRVLQAAIDANELPPTVEEQDADGDPVMIDVESDEPEYEPDKRPLAPPMPMTAAVADDEGDSTMPPEDGEAPPLVKLVPKEPKQKKAPKIDTLTAFSVTYSPLTDDDPKTLADALAIAEDHEWFSKQEATRRMGADYAIQQKQIRAEKNARMRAQARGEEPMPPGMVPPGYAGPMFDDQDEDEPGAKPPFGGR